jgi:hypothetical protein
MQCAKTHIGLHKQALKRAHAMHKITQGSINRLWTKLVREYLMSPMHFEKHYRYSKLNVHDKLFVFSIPIWNGFSSLLQEHLITDHALSRMPLLAKHHGDNWTSTKQSFEIYKSVKQKKFEPLLERFCWVNQKEYWFCLSAKCTTFTNIS